MKLIGLFLTAITLNLYESGDDVIQIDGKVEFDKFLSENPLALVEFYAPWCGHCKSLAPEFKTAATKLKAQGIALVAVDANDDKNKEIASEYGVKGFPTLKVWNKKFGAGFADYEGGRTADAIVEFMLAENRPLMSEVTALADAKSAKPTFVQVGNPETNADVTKLAAEKKANLSFFWIATLEGQTEGNLVFVEDGAAGASLEKGGDLAAFVSSRAYPVLGQLTPENYQFYQDRGLDMFWVGLNTDDSAAIAEIKAGVKDYAGKQSFVWLDYEKFGDFLKSQMGCEEVKCVILVKNNIKQRMSDNEETFGAAGIAAFLKKDADATLKPFTKSQEIPAEREEDNVVVLVGKNFEQEVKGKNVLVFFQAPWCGHCKTAKPEYEKLKAQIARDDIVVAKFDSTENDIPHTNIKVEGFPTFYFFKADAYDTPTVYNGGRDLDSWAKFIQENAPQDTKTDL